MEKEHYEHYVAVDVETTGLHPLKGDRVVEIGGVAIEKKSIVEEFSTLLNVEKPIPESVQRINGITNEMLTGKPRPEEVMPEFQMFLGDGIVIAHNAKFDCRFLRHEFGRLGLAFNNRYICTLKLSRRLFPKLPDHKLETVYRHIFGRLPSDTNLHRAIDDARLVAGIWLEIMDVSQR